MLKKYCVLVLAGAMLLFSCKKKSEDGPAASDEVQTSCTDVNLFSINQDIALGAQVDSQIRSTPAQYVILDSAANGNNAWAYQYLNGIKKEIFDHANVDYETQFKWKIAILKDDTTLNAFCTPGGYIYVYSGIIKYLDNEDDFAGVLGHEIGHAALRHSTDAMMKEQGLSVLLSILGGDKSKLVQIAAQLSLLKYSRCHETQSDEYSVALLRNTKYKCNGAATFFEKLVAAGSANPPEFLSTHPSPDNRVANINAQADRLQCNKTVPASNTEWAKLKSIL